MILKVLACTNINEKKRVSTPIWSTAAASPKLVTCSTYRRLPNSQLNWAPGAHQTDIDHFFQLGKQSGGQHLVFQWSDPNDCVCIYILSVGCMCMLVYVCCVQMYTYSSWIMNWPMSPTDWGSELPLSYSPSPSMSVSNCTENIWHGTCPILSTFEV